MPESALDSLRFFSEGPVVILSALLRPQGKLRAKSASVSLLLSCGF